MVELFENKLNYSDRDAEIIAKDIYIDTFNKINLGLTLRVTDQYDNCRDHKSVLAVADYTKYKNQYISNDITSKLRKQINSINETNANFEISVLTFGFFNESIYDFDRVHRLIITFSNGITVFSNFIITNNMTLDSNELFKFNLKEFYLGELYIPFASIVNIIDNVESLIDKFFIDNKSMIISEFKKSRVYIPVSFGNNTLVNGKTIMDDRFLIINETIYALIYEKSSNNSRLFDYNPINIGVDKYLSIASDFQKYEILLEMIKNNGYIVVSKE